jgi:hypothetical protein
MAVGGNLRTLPLQVWWLPVGRGCEKKSITHGYRKHTVHIYHFVKDKYALGFSEEIYIRPFVHSWISINHFFCDWIDHKSALERVYYGELYMDFRTVWPMAIPE